MDSIYQWVINSWVENLAVLTGIIYIFLSVKQRVSCWFFGIASSVLYFFVFFQSQIYADMLLQVYYVLVGIYGWIHWAGVDASKSMISLPITRVSKRNRLYLLLITCFMMVGIAQFLIYFTDSPVPWLDALTTSLSITATWMLARKVLEHWIIWVIVDLIYIGLFYYRGLFPSILLFLVYTALAVVGYFEWIKQWKKDQHSPAIL
jgi:nicotinamide mononucleotide transporter